MSIDLRTTSKRESKCGEDCRGGTDHAGSGACRRVATSCSLTVTGRIRAAGAIPWKPASFDCRAAVVSLAATELGDGCRLDLVLRHTVPAVLGRVGLDTRVGVGAFVVVERADARAEAAETYNEALQARMDANLQRMLTESRIRIAEQAERAVQTILAEQSASVAPHEGESGGTRGTAEAMPLDTVDQHQTPAAQAAAEAAATNELAAVVQLCVRGLESAPNPEQKKSFRSLAAWACNRSGEIESDRRRVDGARIEAVGYGDQRPVASNDTEEGRAQNRRIEASEI